VVCGTSANFAGEFDTHGGQQIFEVFCCHHGRETAGKPNLNAREIVRYAKESAELLCLGSKLTCLEIGLFGCADGRYLAVDTPIKQDISSAFPEGGGELLDRAFDCS
jgi:hypothetical protein